MNVRIRWIAPGALVLALVAVGAMAQLQVTLQQGKSGQVSWVGGGTSTAEVDALAALEKGHALKMIFTLTAGNYLAGVNVKVRDAKGVVVLDQADTGPVLLAKLPPPTRRFPCPSVTTRRSQRARAAASRWRCPSPSCFPLRVGILRRRPSPWPTL